jgi:hypothetical protein
MAHDISKLISTEPLKTKWKNLKLSNLAIWN